MLERKCKSLNKSDVIFTAQYLLIHADSFECILYTIHRGLGGVVVKFSPPTSEAAGSNLGAGASCWKVGSYLPMPGGLQYSMHWFPPPVNYPSSIWPWLLNVKPQTINQLKF